MKWENKNHDLLLVGHGLNMSCLVGPPGLEPGTSALSGQRSNRTELWARSNLRLREVQ